VEIVGIAARLREVHPDINLAPFTLTIRSSGAARVRHSCWSRSAAGRSPTYKGLGTANVT